ncbi:MAG TPA: adenylate/guanylate cyclase domain-containing protein [Acidimicrobiia bacterium]|nr:adenylate/guanylate cyclase domain-containing protein [Acidimicrobiia bacterium]
MLAGFIVHLVAYVAVCGTLVAIWALGPTGSFEELRTFVENPDAIEAARFWPIWPILFWGAAVAVHAAIVVTFGVFGGRRRRREKRQQDAMLRHAQRAAEIGRDAVSGVMAGIRGRRSTEPASAATPARPGRQWVTVMFTDIVDSTQLNEMLGDEEWSGLLRRHRETVRRAFKDRGGEEVSTQGDGFLARFDNPAEAVLCGIDIQRSMTEGRGSKGVAPRLRIGIHAGEAVHDDGDLVGRVVNLASRVAAEAEPGEILVTEPVADYLGGRIDFEDKGNRELKGISQPRHLLSVVWQGARSDRPRATGGRR